MTPKNKHYSVELNVCPSVARWLDANFESQGNAYDIRNSSFYILFQTALFQKNIKSPNKPLKKTENHIPVRILIKEWDFYHFGWNIPTFAQVKISRLLFDLMMEKFCEHIAYAYAYGGVPRDVTIRRILVENLFEDNELNYYYVRKWYQRKFQNTGKEREVIDFARYTQENITEI